MTSSTDLLSPRVIGRPTWTRFSAEGDAVFELVGRLSPDELMSNIFTDRLLKYMTPEFIKEINDKTAVFLKSHRNMLTQLPGIAIRTLYLYGERDFRRALEDFLYQALCQLLEGNDQKMSLALPFKELIAVPANLAELLFEMTETDKKRKIDEADWMNRLGFNQFRPPAAMLLHWSNQPLLCHSVELISNSLNDNYRHFMFYYAVGLLKCFVEDSRTVDGKLKLRPREQIMRSVEPKHEKAQPMPRQTAKRRRTTPSTTEHPAAPLDMNRHYITTPITECVDFFYTSPYVRTPIPTDMEMPTEIHSKNCLVHAVSTLPPNELLNLIVGKKFAKQCPTSLNNEQRNSLRQQVKALKLNQAEVLSNISPPWLSEDSDNFIIGNSRKLCPYAASIFWRKVFYKVFGGSPEILPSENAKQIVHAVLYAMSRWRVGQELSDAFTFEINARSVPFVDLQRTVLDGDNVDEELDEIQLAVYSNINMFCVHYMLHFMRRLVALTTDSESPSPNYDITIRQKSQIVTVSAPSSSDSSSSSLESDDMMVVAPAFKLNQINQFPHMPRMTFARRAVLMSTRPAEASARVKKEVTDDVTKSHPEPEVICLSSDED